MPTPVDKATQDQSDKTQRGGRQALLDWANGHVSEWEEWRNKRYAALWDSLTKKWNCTPDPRPADEVMKRTRIVSPALQQAVEDGAAEMEEIVLSREGWFDVEDDATGGQNEQWQVNRILLADEMERADVSESLLECFFLSALYGTAIGKVTVTQDDDFQFTRDPRSGELVSESEVTPLVGLEPVLPWHFVIDTAVNKPGKAGIRMALGMAHRLPQPKHKILALQNDEIVDPVTEMTLVDATYWDVPLGDKVSQGSLPNFVSITAFDPAAAVETSPDADSVLITEYHGMVPKALFDAARDDAEAAPDEIDTREMVEAIVTYANDAWLLSVRENTNLKRARMFVSAPWDIVPGSFWGRGVGEKAFPAQRVLDTFLRAQIDAMRYHVYPIMGVNSTRVPARQKIIWGPGMEFRTQGNPADAVFPIVMPPAGAGTFQLNALLERNITQATGITPDAGRGEMTLGATSAIRGAFMKRTNRTLRLLSKNFLNPFVELYYLLQVELQPELFQQPDTKFRVRTAAGLVAREAENMTLSAMLQFVPPDTPAFWAIVSAIFGNTSAQDKGQVQQALQATMQQLGQPNPQEELAVAKDEAIVTDIGARTRKTEATTLKTMQDINKSQRETARGTIESARRSGQARAGGGSAGSTPARKGRAS